MTTRLGAIWDIDQFGAGQRSETIAQQRGVLAERAQSQRITHRYAPPLEAISKTLMIDPPYVAAVLEGLAQAKRREFATGDEVEAAFRRFDP